MIYLVKTKKKAYLIEGDFEITPSGDLMFLQAESESIVAYFKSPSWQYFMRLYQQQPQESNPFSRN